MKNYFLQLFNSMKKWIPQMFGGFFKWIILSLITGTAVGFISSAFHIGLEKCADIRKEQPYYSPASRCGTAYRKYLQAAEAYS